MQLLNVMEGILPHLVGPEREAVCRHLSTVDGESTYELAFLNRRNCDPESLRLAVFIHLDEQRLHQALAQVHPQAEWTPAEVANFLARYADKVLPLLKDFNGRETHYERIVALRFGGLRLVAA